MTNTEVPTELQVLDGMINELATSREAGYFAWALASLYEQGFDGMPDADVAEVARYKVIEHLGAWAAAVEPKTLF